MRTETKLVERRLGRGKIRNVRPATERNDEVTRTTAMTTPVSISKRHGEKDVARILMGKDDDGDDDAVETRRAIRAAEMFFQNALIPNAASPEQRHRERLLSVDVDRLAIDLYEGKNEAVEVNVNNYNTLMLAQAARGQVDACLRTYDRMTSNLRLDNDDDENATAVLPNELTYIAILRACKEARDPDTALGLIRQLEKSEIDISDSMWAILGQTYVRSDRLDDAIQLHRERCERAAEVFERSVDPDEPPVRWNVPLTTAVLSGCVRDKSGPMIRYAWELFDEFRCGYGHPDKNMLATMISACGVTGEAEKALSLFEEYEVDGLGVPPQQAYAAVMRSCARNRHFNREAFTYFDRMLAQQYPANIQCMNILLDACALTGDVDRAKSLWSAIEAHPAMEPNTYAYTTMLNVYARGQRVRKPTRDHWAVPPLMNPRQGLPAGVELGYDTDGDARLAHIEEEASGRRTDIFQKYDPDDWARRTGKWNEHPIFDDDHSEEHAEERMWAELEETEDERKFLSAEGGDAKRLLQIPGSDDDGRIVTDELGVVTTTTTDEASHDATGGRVDAVSIRANDAVEYVSSTNNESFPARQQRYIEEANALFHRMIESDNVQPDRPVLNALLKVHTEALRIRRAESLLESYETYGIEPDQFTYGSLVGMYARSRRLEDAFRTKTEMESRGHKLTGHLYGALIHACAIAKSDEGNEMTLKAMDLLREMAQHSPPVRTRDRFLREIRKKCQALNEENVEGFDDNAISVVPPSRNAMLRAPIIKQAKRQFFGNKKTKRRLSRIQSTKGYKRTTV